MDKMAPENVSLPVLFLISTIPPMPHVIHFSFVCCIPYTLATESALKNTLYFTGYTTGTARGLLSRNA